MINVILNLIVDSTERINALGGIFRRCCEQGCLNQHIINVLAEKTTKDEFLFITGVSTTGKSLNVENFPSEWSQKSSFDSTVNIGIPCIGQA